MNDCLCLDLSNFGNSFEYKLFVNWRCALLPRNIKLRRVCIVIFCNRYFCYLLLNKNLVKTPFYLCITLIIVVIHIFFV